MSLTQIIDQNKIQITYRIEAGCLGANGKDKVVGFCQYLTQQLNQCYGEFSQWQSAPHTDRKLAHIEYGIQNKSLNSEQVKTYFSLLKQDKDTFEEELEDQVVQFIEDYLGR